MHVHAEQSQLYIMHMVNARLLSASQMSQESQDQVAPNFQRPWCKTSAGTSCIFCQLWRWLAQRAKHGEHHGKRCFSMYLVAAVLGTRHESHHIVKHWPCAAWVPCPERVPARFVTHIHAAEKPVRAEKAILNVNPHLSLRSCGTKSASLE